MKDNKKIVAVVGYGSTAIHTALASMKTEIIVEMPDSDELGKELPKTDFGRLLAPPENKEGMYQNSKIPESWRKRYNDPRLK